MQAANGGNGEGESGTTESAGGEAESAGTTGAGGTGAATPSHAGHARSLVGTVPPPKDSGAVMPTPDAAEGHDEDTGPLGGDARLSLTIRFTGLSVLTQSDDVTSVVFPTTAGHHEGMEPHVPMLYLGEIVPIQGSPLPPAIPLTRAVLRITDEDRPRGRPTIPASLLNIAQLSGSATVKDQALGDAPDLAVVKGRVDLDMHGSIEAFNPGTYSFKDGGGNIVQSLEMRTFLEFSETVIEKDLRIELTLLDPGGGASTLRIYPPRDPGQGNRVTLHVWHVPSSQLPPAEPPVEQPGKVSHFKSYYSLFDGVNEELDMFLDASPSASEGPRTRTCPSIVGTSSGG